LSQFVGFLPVLFLNGLASALFLYLVLKCLSHPEGDSLVSLIYSVKQALSYSIFRLAPAFSPTRWLLYFVLLFVSLVLFVVAGLFKKYFFHQARLLALPFTIALMVLVLSQPPAFVTPETFLSFPPFPPSLPSLLIEKYSKRHFLHIFKSCRPCRKYYPGS